MPFVDVILMASNSSFVDEFEAILKKSELITQVNRIGDDFEVFFGDEKIPCDLGIKEITAFSFVNYESFLKFKAGPDPDHHFAMQFLRGKTLEDLVKQIEDEYIKSFQSGISKVKQGFQKDSGTSAEEAETTEN